MAKILDFVRRPAAPAATAAAALATLLEDFSIEVMPRTAAKVDDFRAILPAGTRVYLAHIDGTDFADMLATARRLADEGFAVMPHFPARGIACRGRARRPPRRLRRRRRPRGAGDRRRHRPPARPLSPRRCSCCAPASSTPAASPACTSPATRRATATSTPPAASRLPGRPRRQGRLRPRDRRRDGDRHPVLLRGRPGHRLGRPPRAPPASRSRSTSASPAPPSCRPCSSSPWPAASARRCACCSAAPPTSPSSCSRSSPPSILAELAAHKAAHPDCAIERVHFFPLGGITATTDYTGAAHRPAAPGPGMTPSGAALRPRRHPRRHRPPAPRRLRRRSSPSAAATCRLAEYRTHIMGQPERRTSSPATSPARTPAILDRKEAMFRDSLAASVEPVARHPRPARLGRGQRRRLRRRHQRPARQRRSPCSPPPASPTACPSLVIGDECARAEARPRPLPRRHGRRSAPPRRARSPSRTAAPASAPPAAPAPTSSA